MGKDFKEKPKFDEYGMTQWHWLVRHRENFKLGKRVQIGNFTVIGCEHGVTIEDDVKIGYSCVIMTYSTVDNKQGSVVLKKGCKIGANSTIMPNVTIGENAVIGANSFVNRNIPSDEVWAGTPARFIKKNKAEFIAKDLSEIGKILQKLEPKKLVDKAPKKTRQ